MGLCPSVPRAWCTQSHWLIDWYICYGPLRNRRPVLKRVNPYWNRSRVTTRFATVDPFYDLFAAAEHSAGCTTSYTWSLWLACLQLLLDSVSSSATMANSHRQGWKKDDSIFLREAARKQSPWSDLVANACKCITGCVTCKFRCIGCSSHCHGAKPCSNTPYNEK